MAEQQKEHRLVLENRGMLMLSGVTRVESSDEQRVALATVAGVLVAEGEGLHILHLDLERGDLQLSGRVDRVLYPEAPLGERARGRGGALARRLFK